jgi:hypothetical protein
MRAVAEQLRGDITTDCVATAFGVPIDTQSNGAREFALSRRKQGFESSRERQ